MQAKAEARAAKADERMAKMEEHMAKADERMDRFDRRLDATRKLIETGMRMLVKLEKDRIESGKAFDRRIHLLDQRIHALVEAQDKTDKKLDRLIDFWAKRRNNGH